MSGKEILVDTNILLYLLNGSDTLEEILQGKDVYISFITELELTGKKISDNEDAKITQLLNDCSVIALNNSIKAKYKEIRSKYKLKLADAVIAATSIVYDMPLITADKQFKTIKELTLVTYHHGVDPA